ncbi:MAG: hypothetical protein EOP54_10220 [Sphingobacteriales bacterium]|nr:MAG: hypothetical protein EOP54_10220 [Sphingobacteriales bacterium]
MKSLKTVAAFCLGIILVALTFTACNKGWLGRGCFDKALYEAYKDKACTMDCPGVTGCDGKTYCNACIAATKGIRVK